MKTIVSNTSPLRYLTCIGEHDLLPELFAPDTVQQYFLSLSNWIEIYEVKIYNDNSSLLHLDNGEIEAIILAKQKKADFAAFILSKLGPMPAMKLHKLVYYCQAWSLVWDEELSIELGIS